MAGTTTIVQVGSIACGTDAPFLISGPCVIEDEKIMHATAEKLKKISDKLGLPIIYKSSYTKDNRSSVEYYQGPGLDEGLRLLERIKTDYGFPILSDVHDAAQARAAGDILDVIQIPAYLCMQTSVVTAAAATGSVINLKHGQFISPSNMQKPVAKVESEGNNNILLTERGYAFGYNDLVVDPRAFYELRQTGYPVIFDITHSIRKYGIPSSQAAGGQRQYLQTIGLAGAAAGIHGFFIEAHPDPASALCDAASQYCVDDP